MAILWQSTSGLKMNFYEYTGDYPSDYDLTYKASGTIPGTDGSSRNAAISTDKFDFNPYYEVAWEQMESMGQSSIKYTFIYLDSADELESVFSPPLTVSSPHISYNSNVSIVSFPDAARIAWVCSDNGGWEPMQSQACLRSTTVSGGFTPISIFAQSVSSASVAKEADDQYYFAWSEIYTGQEAQYNDDANRYVKSTNLAYARTLNTDAGAIQLHDAPSGSDMRLSAFYNPSGVNYFTESGPLESPQKIAGPLAHDETMSRGVSIVDTTSGTALYLDIGAIMLDGKPVGFTEMNDEPLKVEDRIEWMRHQESFPKPGLEMINPYLVSEPFEMSANSKLTFSEKTAVTDEPKLQEFLGENGYLHFRMEIVNESGDRVLHAVSERNVRAGQLPPVAAEHSLDKEQGISETVRLRLLVQTNIEDLNYQIVNTYFQKKGNQAGDEKVAEVDDNLINSYDLLQNYPNPFNPNTQLTFELPEAGKVRLEVYNVMGQRVAVLADGQMSAGRHVVNFDATTLVSGVYFYRLRAGGNVLTRQMTLIK